MDLTAAYEETFRMVEAYADHAFSEGGGPIYAAPEISRPAYADIIAELKPLFARHWAEVALYQDRIKLAPQYARYAVLAEDGVLRIFVAREQSVIVGYTVFFIGAHPHYGNDLWATNDLFWVVPERRGQAIAAQLWDCVERDFRAAGVSMIRVDTKAAHPAAQRFLESLGYAHVVAGYAKCLKDSPHG